MGVGVGVVVGVGGGVGPMHVVGHTTALARGKPLKAPTNQLTPFTADTQTTLAVKPLGSIGS